MVKELEKEWIYIYTYTHMYITHRLYVYVSHFAVDLKLTTL